MVLNEIVTILYLIDIQLSDALGKWEAGYEKSPFYG